MHGAGNDYIYVNTMLYPLENPQALAVKWSRAHTGIGADGLVLIGRSDVADFSMRIFNADGSEAMMCGNASRCIGKYVYDKGLSAKRAISLETLSGVKRLVLSVENGKVAEVTVDMGIPVIRQKELTLEAGGMKYTGTAVSMGNPHFAVFIEDINRIDLPAAGPLLERHPYFPDRTNVEFVQVMEPDKCRMRVWERGSGITLACGTGACAAAVAGMITGKTGRAPEIIMDGGSLRIRWDEAAGKVFMTGGAVTVFEGEIEEKGI
jgi:diaminopimelate epimerase